MSFDSVINEIQSSFEYETYDVARRDVGDHETILTMRPRFRISGIPFELHITYRDLVAADSNRATATGDSFSGYLGGHKIT